MFPGFFHDKRKDMHNIIIATHNPDKARELQSLLPDDNIQVQTLADYPAIGDIPETGTTLLENSLLKARTVHQMTGVPAIADDTGLEVDILDGAPGIYAARYAGKQATYRDNVEKLLHELRHSKESERTARFRTIMSFVDDDHEIWAEGIVEGMIMPEPRGKSGFGYDPVFLVPDLGQTFAEMPAKVKHGISHRGKAMKALLAKIKPLFNRKTKESPIE
ncbi:MAG: RdgB/HAM1 family non-canonical purine NTP pyrophosphatase [Fidelibacterota bacterium]